MSGSLSEELGEHLDRSEDATSATNNDGLFVLTPGLRSLIPHTQRASNLGNKHFKEWQVATYTPPPPHSLSVCIHAGYDLIQFKRACEM